MKRAKITFESMCSVNQKIMNIIIVLSEIGYNFSTCPVLTEK
jgi:hypothetical protein